MKQLAALAPYAIEAIKKIHLPIKNPGLSVQSWDFQGLDVTGVDCPDLHSGKHHMPNLALASAWQVSLALPARLSQRSFAAL